MTPINNSATSGLSPKVHQLRRSRNAPTEGSHCEGTSNTKGLRVLGPWFSVNLPCITTFEKVRHFAKLNMVAE